MHVSLTCLLGCLLLCATICVPFGVVYYYKGRASTLHTIGHQILEGVITDMAQMIDGIGRHWQHDIDTQDAAILNLTLNYNISYLMATTIMLGISTPGSLRGMYINKTNKMRVVTATVNNSLIFYDHCSFDVLNHLIHFSHLSMGNTRQPLILCQPKKVWIGGMTMTKDGNFRFLLREIYSQLRRVALTYPTMGFTLKSALYDNLSDHYHDCFSFGSRVFTTARPLLISKDVHYNVGELRAGIDLQTIALEQAYIVPVILLLSMMVVTVLVTVTLLYIIYQGAQEVKQANNNNHRFSSWCWELEKLFELVQQYADKNNQSQRFLAGVSHELKTPLSIILGHAEQALQPQDDNNNRMTSIEQIYQAAYMLVHRVNDLLDYTKYHSQTLKVATNSIDIMEIIRKVIKLMEQHAKRKAIQIQLSKHEDSMYVQGDEIRIEQCLLNIIQNSIKFTACGKRRGIIQVSISRLENCISVSVQDNGCGIAKNVLRQVGTQYFTTDKQGGTGLGLFMCKSLLEAMGGRLLVTSHGTGCGTTVTVVLLESPHHIMDHASVDPGTQPLAIENNPIRTMKDVNILVAEDNDTLRMLYCMQLEKYYTVVGVDNGEAMIERVYTQKFDVLLLDYLMPNMDGIEVLHTLREIPQYAQTPVLFITGCNNITLTQLGNDKNCNILYKPVRRRVLYDAIQDALGLCNRNPLTLT